MVALYLHVTKLRLTTLVCTGTNFPLVQTMPAEFISFLFLFSAQWTDHSDVLFVASLHHRATLGTLLNTHSFDQIVLGDFFLKLLYLAIPQNSQAPDIYVVPFFTAINWRLILADVWTQKSRSACVQDAATKHR